MHHRTLAMFSLAAVTAFACGGGSKHAPGGNAALGKSFTYGAPQAPTAAEQTAADTAQADLASAAAFGGAPDATQGLALSEFAGAVASAALGATPLALAVAKPSPPSPGPSLADTAACATVGPTSITFRNCLVADAGFNMTLDGTISFTATTTTWDMVSSFAGTQGASAYNVAIHDAGSFATTGSRITGTATEDYGGSVSASGQTLSFGISTAAVVDVTYQSTPAACITGGSIEVRRVWTQKPPGASGGAFADSGVKLTWTGCGSLQVSHSL
jgi:hypothetical protein